MNPKQRPVPPPTQRGHNAPALTLPPALANEMVALFNAGRWGELEQKASTAVQRYPSQVFAWAAIA